MDDVLTEDVFDHERSLIDMLDARDVDLSNVTNQEKALLETLSSVHSAKQIRISQADPLHATYIDKSETSVDTGALRTIQQAEYVITGAGTERPRSVGQSESDEDVPQDRAAVEFEPRSDDFDS